MSKKSKDKQPNTDWVLVEAVSMFRIRYMIEVPKGKADWALDTVVCNDASEFSQKHLDEMIVSHRVLTKEEALAQCEIDNPEYSCWDTEHKLETFFTPCKKEDLNE